MKIDALVAEIGSTTTVVSAFNDLNTVRPKLLGQGMWRTTVQEGDVYLGLSGAVDVLKAILKTDDLSYDHFFACSSAAGGLKITVHGLVYDMTVKAAKEAALGAGGNIQHITAGKLMISDLKRIAEQKPNLILIAGGVDYGERETAMANTAALLPVLGETPVIYAGNCENVQAIRDMFDAVGKGEQLYATENVYPKIDTLNVMPTRRIIQSVFETHIVKAEGMARIREMVDDRILPTPGAVMQSAQILSEIMPDLMVVDLGGATTDVHSVTSGNPEILKMLLSPEPVAKRTVEGDLGVYVNAAKLIAMIGENKLMQLLSMDSQALSALIETHVLIPKNEQETAYIHALAQAAVQAAVQRHVGRYTMRFTGGGQGYAEGKDLTYIKRVIGTGGVLTRLPKAETLILNSFHNPKGDLLLPKQAPDILIDNQYIMAAAGVLSTHYPEAAKKLLLESLGIGEVYDESISKTGL
ncbi:glutamate mutase L [Fusibacter paucivorans]|uniref:Glutamate mutase L n=1 Tax=Fusibacter paucivorans TaxID=76009 RepID=A0ABS5PRP2_9FIRM|nr:GlmL-related ornithine degradation protein [Fusibacter paucivorans]MBS7527748.1 glutamate mutase L [Fusibacter paucivorans]